MEDEKLLMKKDLSLIIQLDAKLDYQDKVSVKKIYDAAISKDMFKSPLGIRYIKKLEQIINEKDSSKCIICAKVNANASQSVLCNDCKSKLGLNKVNEKITTPDRGKNELKHTNTDVRNNTVEGTKENIEYRVESKDNENSSGSNKKGIIFGIIALVAIIAIISAIGLGTILAVLTYISIGILVYCFVKKKPKKIWIIITVVLLILTGLFSGDIAKDGQQIADKYAEKVEKNLGNSSYELKSNGVPSEQSIGTMYYYLLVSDGTERQIMCAFNVLNDREVTAAYIMAKWSDEQVEDIVPVSAAVIQVMDPSKSETEANDILNQIYVILGRPYTFGDYEYTFDYTGGNPIISIVKSGYAAK